MRDPDAALHPAWPLQTLAYAMPGATCSHTAALGGLLLPISRTAGFNTHQHLSKIAFLLRLNKQRHRARKIAHLDKQAQARNKSRRAWYRCHMLPFNTLPSATPFTSICFVPCSPRQLT